MRCPSCLSAINGPHEACPTCGFTLAALDIVFGTIPRHRSLLNDLSGVFDERQQQRLKRILSEFARHFPGLHVSIVTMEVNARFKPREYLFWLVNRGHFAPIERKLERSLIVVLFIDTLSRSVFLTTGYGLHAALPEEKLQAAIEVALPQFKKGNLFRGSLEILSRLRQNLRLHCSSSASRPPASPITKTSGATAELQDVR